MRFATVATLAVAAAAVPTFAASSPARELTPAQIDQFMKIIASSHGPASLSAREYEELLARNNFTDMLKGIGKGLAGNFKAFVSPLLPFKREELELLARELESIAARDANVARGLDSISAREYNEMLARDFWGDFKKGFVEGFTGTLKTVAPIALSFLKREELELLAREFDDILAREVNVARGLNELD